MGSPVAGTAGTVCVESGAQVTFMGKLDIADRFDGTPSGTVTVTGSNSALTQTGDPLAITVGQPTGGSATLNVNSGGAFTALGPVIINATGTVNVNGGVFNANCISSTGVLVDGGRLTMAGTLNLASGVWINTRNGGLIDFGSGSFTFPAYAGYSGGKLKAGAISLPYGGPSSLTAEGSGSSVTGGSLFVATGGSLPSVSFADNATASFTSINIACPGTYPPSEMVDIDSAQVSLTGPLDMADSGGGPLWAFLHIGGSSGQLTQSGSSPITIGQWGVGSATLLVDSSGTFTATGPTTINPTGTLDAGNGTFNAYGGVVIDGGKLLIGSASFTLGAGKTLTVQNNGTVDFHVKPFTVDRNTTLSVLSGADLVNLATTLTIGKTTNGSLVVDGLGSSVGLVMRPALSVGSSGAQGTAAFRNLATASFGSVAVAYETSAVSGTSGTVSVESGAQVTFTGKLDIADGGSGTPTGAVTVTGSNSALTQTGDPLAITVGQSTGGSATFNVNSGGSFTALGRVTINATGTVNVNGGVFNASCTSKPGVIANGGKLTMAGTLNLASGVSVHAQNGGLIDFGSGGFTFPAGGAELAIYSGQLKVGALSLPYGSPSDLSVMGPSSSAICGSLSVATGGSSPSVYFSSGATGSFTSIRLAYPATQPPAGMVQIKGALVSLSGPLDLASSGAAPLSAILNVDSSGSLAQTANAPVSIGQAGSGAAVLTLTNGGMLVATGTTTVYATGLLDASGGIFTANNDVVVDGGTLRPGAAFSLGAAKTLTARNGGQVDFFGSPFLLARNSACNVQSSAHLENISTFSVGMSGTGNGSLTVDGLGSSAAAGTLYAGGGGTNGAATFQNGAAGSFGFVAVAGDSVPGSTGSLDIESGAHVTFSSMLAVADNGPGSTGTVTVAGAGSQLTQVNSTSWISLGRSSGGSRHGQHQQRGHLLRPRADHPQLHGDAQHQRRYRKSGFADR